MPVLAWIVVSGVTMSALALIGGVTLLLPDAAFRRIVLPLVALAAGSLLGGALFHLLPEAVERMGNGLDVYAWAAGGIVSFLVLEQFLHWHHCHRATGEHAPLGHLLLVADGLHNLIGGLAVGSAFVIDIRVGIVTWLVAAAHEVPQELGDFGILLNSGWSRRAALAYNVASALTFLVGALVAYWISASVAVHGLLAFAAGNFLYIAAADLVPEITAPPGARTKLLHTGVFLAGMALLFGVGAAG